MALSLFFGMESPSLTFGRRIVILTFCFQRQLYFQPPLKIEIFLEAALFGSICRDGCRLSEPPLSKEKLSLLKIISVVARYSKKLWAPRNFYYLCSSMAWAVIYFLFSPSNKTRSKAFGFLSEKMARYYATLVVLGCILPWSPICEHQTQKYISNFHWRMLRPLQQAPARASCDSS